MENQEQLLVNEVERERLMDKVEVLDKVKELVLLPYGETMTTEMVAEYYEVTTDTIRQLVVQNKTELSTNGYENLTGKQLSEIKSLCQIKSRAKSLAIFTRRAILNVGMLLRDSKVAKEVRSKLLDMSEDKQVIGNTISEITQEQLLMLNVIQATTDEERMLALSKLNTYKESKILKVKEELDVAIVKIQNHQKSDATYGLRETANNLGVKERKLSKYLQDNKYMYRQRKPTDDEKPTGRLKAYAEYCKEPTRYFTEITPVGRDGIAHNNTVFTIEGVDYFRTLIEEING